MIPKVRERSIIIPQARIPALLDGRMTQYRIPVRWPHPYNHPDADFIVTKDGPDLMLGCEGTRLDAYSEPSVRWIKVVCPLGVPGDRLWVKEVWWTRHEYIAGCTAYAGVVYDVDLDDAQRDGRLNSGWKKKTSICMPRSFSRITLEIEAVRAERLQEIDEEDAEAEGVRTITGNVFVGREGPGALVTPWPTAREAFADLWDFAYGKKHPWANNDWVWVPTLRRVK